MTDSQRNLDDFLGTRAQPRWRRWAKWIVLALLLLALAFGLSRCFGAAASAGYATEEVRRGNLEVTVSATGNLAPTNQVNVGSEQSGLVEAVFVRNNDRVVKGQPLARLDLSRLQDALTQSQASLAAAQATVEQNRATLAQTRSNLARLEEVYRLSGGKVPSKTELDTARADQARAVANVSAAQAQVAQARAQVSTNQTNLSKGTIYSPVTGVVLSRQVEPGQTVAASLNVATLFTIAEDLSQMKLEVKVDEADVGALREGARASFTVDAYPGRTFPARVTRVDLGANATPQINSAGTTVTSSSNVVAYTTALTVQNPDLLLKPGMTATADIVTAERQNVLLVPNAALRFKPQAAGGAGASSGGGGVTGVLMPRRPNRAGGSGGNTEERGGAGQSAQVWVVGADGQPSPISVRTGQTNGTVTEVSGTGVKAGLKVITGQLAAAD